MRSETFQQCLGKSSQLEASVRAAAEARWKDENLGIKMCFDGGGMSSEQGVGSWVDDVVLDGSSEGSQLVYHGYADWHNTCGDGAWDTSQLRGQFCISGVIGSSK